MITKDEYLKAKAIVEQYEHEEYVQGMQDAEDEDDYYEDEDDYYEDEDDIEERRQNERFEMAMNCTCGAWYISKSTGQVGHAADCICGAE